MRFPRKPPPLAIILATLLGLGVYHAAQSQIQNWSTTAGSNNAASPLGAAEGMARSAVNDVIRENMKEVRRLAEQLVLGTFGPDGGSANAYFITPAIAPSSTFVSGAVFRFIPAFSNTTAAPTLKVGTVGPLTIARISNASLEPGDLRGGVPAQLMYRGDSGGFVLMNPVSAYISAVAIPSGTIKTAGRETIWLPAGALIPRTTSGATISSMQLSSNNFMLKASNYDGASQNFAQFQVGMPKSWDLGTVAGQFYWTAQAGSGTVQWYLQCVNLRDDDVLTTAFGTARGVTDTIIALNDLHISSETAAVTPGGTAAANGMMGCEVYRDAPADSSTANALLIGLQLFYNSNAANDN